MSADLLREAAALMRERAEVATPGLWRLADLAGANEVWSDRDPAGWDSLMVATTATRLNPNPGATGHGDAAHIASWHPAFALVVADWLDATADARDVALAFGMGEPDRALAVARAYLGRES